MKLLAISDLHLAQPANRQGLEQLAPRPDDWLILGGDIGETLEQLEFALKTLTPRFAQLLWVPGNHELWSLAAERELRGQARYERLVALCRSYGCLTPEDPYPRWPGEGPACVIAPLFLLYDYSFRPQEISRAQALDWAMESGVLCSDEMVLFPDPFPTRDAWCAARCELTERRLEALGPGVRTVLVNHFPLLEAHAQLRRIPRFSLWCGTTRTASWHQRFNAVVVVSGHLHIRATRWEDGVRFEEVSLGYSGQWSHPAGVGGYLREILPGPAPAAPGSPTPRPQYFP